MQQSDVDFARSPPSAQQALFGERQTGEETSKLSRSPSQPLRYEFVRG
jgi:hypothetical protein